MDGFGMAFVRSFRLRFVLFVFVLAPQHIFFGENEKRSKAVTLFSVGDTSIDHMLLIFFL